MGTIIKVYTAIFLVLMVVFISIGILSAMLDIQNARDYHSLVVGDIESSNHNPDIIKEHKKQAEENGYILEVIPRTYSNGQYEDIGSKVVLKYKYSIPFLNISSEKEIVGYAT